MAMAALVVVLVAAGAFTDLSQGKIYNKLTYPGILSGLGLNAIGSLVDGLRQAAASDAAAGSADAWTSWKAALGWVGLGDSLLGLAACGGSMVLCYALFRIGGGDVKLLAMVGAWLGLERGIEVLLWTFVVGGAVALVTLIWRVGVWRLATRLIRQLAWSLHLAFWRRWDVWGPLTLEERRELDAPLHLAPSALAGLLIVLSCRGWDWA